MESEDMEDIIGEPVWNVEDKDRGMIDLKLVYPFILISVQVSEAPVPSDEAVVFLLLFGKILAKRNSSEDRENLDMARQRPSNTGTMPLQTVLRVLNDAGLSCLLSSSSLVRMLD